MSIIFFRRFSLFLLTTFILLVMIGCNNAAHKKSTIRISVTAPASGKIMLTRVGFLDDKDKQIDSTPNSFINTYSFTVNNDLSILYKLKVPLYGKQIYFIADADTIDIKVDIADRKAEVNGSVNTNVLYHFYQSIKEQNNCSIKGNYSITPNPNRVVADFTLPFIDTVTSPAIFMLAYNTIEFGHDYKLLKDVVDKAANRFPEVSYIYKLRLEVYRMTDIYEKEFKLNESLPSINLMNSDSVLYSTSALKGKYYYINFWSTWCDPCIKEIETMKSIYNSIDTSKLVFVSAAIDDNKTDWKNLIKQHNYNWINLIDEKMWKGDAVNTLKFDSIPFNFLVSPHGIVLAKAISPDSLLIQLKKYQLIIK